jgi:hypothetical protein
VPSLRIEYPCKQLDHKKKISKNELVEVMK